jgi:hypothetical protein
MFKKGNKAMSTTEEKFSVEGLRLSVEVVSMLNRFGYKLDDSKLFEVAELCSKIAQTKT